MKVKRNFFQIGCLLGIILLFINQVSYSQQPAYFILGEKEFEGIQIYDVIQDNDNNYWFSTDQGFFKYDNYTFEQISCKEMKGTSAFGFVKNKSGIIYCYNLNKQIIKIENSICSVFYELKEDEFSSDICLNVSVEGELQVNAKTCLVLNASGSRKKTMIPDFNYYGFPFPISENKVISHVGNTNTILIYNGTDFSYQTLVSNEKKVNGVLRFFKSNHSVYAVSTGDKQFYIYKPEKNEIIPFNRFEELNEKEFYRFYEEDGSLWAAGTISGVYQFSQGSSFDIKGKFYKDYLISDVFKDNEGNLLLSTFNFGVLVIPSLAIPDVLPFEGMENPVSIEFDNELGILCGTLKGELWQIHPSGNKIINEGGSRPVQSVFSFENFPYIIYDDGKLKAIHRKTGKIIELASVSLKDAVLHTDGNVYISFNKGIAKISEENGTPIFERISGLDLRTYAIEKDENGNLFFATSEGLKKMNSKGIISDVLFHSKQVFVNDLFSNGKMTCAASKNDGILEIKKGKITGNIVPQWKDNSIEMLKLIRYENHFYLLTSKGFYILNYDGQVISQLNKLHGFSTQRIFDFEIKTDKNPRNAAKNEIWLVHSNGIHKMNLNHLYPNIVKPTIRLNSFFVNDSKIEFKKQNSFDFQSRNFRFEFSSPTLKNKENIRYHFKLEGYDSDWQINDYFSNEISYNALAPGEYTFRVKAENQGVFSEEINYSFTIEGPFYYSWWFILVITGGIVGVVILFYRRKLRNQKRKAQLINEMNASRLAAIQSQMNPHFIFNSLNAIQDLVLKGDVDNSYTFITKFSDLVRRTLDYSGKDFIEFEQEIKLLELYLSLEKLRFKEQLQISFETNDIEDVMIPPMLIQPFIENAILHGLLHKEGKKLLKIHFKMNDSLHCFIEDNGIGRKASMEIKSRQRSDHESFSGKAIKKRFDILKDIFGEDLGFQYEDLVENGKVSGTKVVLKIPVKHKF